MVLFAHRWVKQNFRWESCNGFKNCRLRLQFPLSSPNDKNPMAITMWSTLFFIKSSPVRSLVYKILCVWLAKWCTENSGTLYSFTFTKILIHIHDVYLISIHEYECEWIWTCMCFTILNVDAYIDMLVSVNEYKVLEFCTISATIHPHSQPY